MTDLLFSTKNLYVEVNGKEIITNVSFEIQKLNNIIVIAGSSGCGKTTLLNVINNYNLPKNYKLMGTIDYKNSKIKMIGHRPVFNPFLKVKEIVKMFVESYGFENTADFYLKKFNLESITDKIIGNDENKSLSTGQLVQLSILLNTMEIPDLLILDEPLSNLDIKTSINIMKILKGLNIPIILTLHHPNNLILEFVDYLYVLEKGEIIVSKSLSGMSNKLEYYEKKMMHNPECDFFNAVTSYFSEESTNCFSIDVENSIVTKKKEKTVEILNFNENKSNVYFHVKVYNSLYFLLTYFLRNKIYLIATIGSYVPVLITYLLLTGTDFSDKTNGYVILINLFFMYTTTFTGTTIIPYFEIEKMIPMLKYNIRIGIINERLFYLFFVVYNFFITTLYTIFISSVDTYLNSNNNILLNDFLSLASYTKFLEIYSFIPLLYLTETVNGTMSLWITYAIFQVLNSGIMTTLHPEIKTYSMYYYLINLLSVKAQEVYDYPLLQNGEYIYSIYGYKTDTTNYYYYLMGFLIIPTLFFLFPKNDRLFLT